ncbi:hypothetical protein [Rossellomorea vietnamensis]|uniref:hypothetical protein n=1 Tax=Rossellomorea vietnamensis TaxID=218284 RepID=UPI001BC8CBCC|nr:hypothetical protein [Rossellomorea vietnamensis]
MKKDRLKKLFDHVDENEKSSVEFQTVWRKAHRRDWKRRLSQSAGPNLAVLMILLILTPLAGYYFINPEHPSDSAQSSANQNEKVYDLSGKVYNFPNQIVIKGETGLPEGAILTIEHLERDGQTLIRKEEVSTTSTGYFQYTTDRLEKDKEYIVKVILYPHLQNESIKNQIGERGENLKKRKNVFWYQRGEVEYFGMKMVGIVNKIEDTTEYVSSEFLRSEKEFSDINQIVQ